MTMDTITNYIEITCADGTITVLKRDWNRVYDMHEFHKSGVSCMKKFPFFSFKRRAFTRFRFQEKYQTIQSDGDREFVVPYTCIELARMFGIKVISEARLKVENDLN